MMSIKSNPMGTNMTVNERGNQVTPDSTYSETSLQTINNTVEQDNSKNAQTAKNVTESSHTSNSRNIKTVCTNFLLISSNYALNQIGRTTTKKRKFFWLLVLIIGLIGSFSQVGQFLSVYFSYPVVISLNVINMKKQQLPAVTICNMNIIRKDFLPCLEKELNYDECFTIDKKIRPNKTRENYTHNQQNTSLPICEEAEGNITEKKLKLASSFFSLDFDNRIKFGHSAEDFITFCSFNDRICSAKDFKVSFSSTYGSCYTFNLATGNKRALNVQFPGPRQALVLILNLESDKYISSTDVVGARVQIHDPHEDHYVEEDGLNVSPGFETSIALSKYSITRLPAPYRDRCEHYETGNSIKKCQRECANNLSIDSCSCSLMKNTDKKFRPCDFTKPHEYCCVLDINMEECDIACPLPCDETHYNIKASSLVWPSKVYYDAYPEEFSKHAGILSYEKVRESWLRLRIYFDTLDSKIYEQKPMFQSSEVFSQIGGQLGLWLGLSLIFLFECAVNFMDLCIYERKRL